MAPDLNKADRDYLFTNDWRGQNIPARVGELLVAYNQEFNLLNQAAQMKAPCDWGIDLSMGPDTLLPHLARCKAVAVASKIRVQWHLQNNREAKAVDELIATLTLGRNASRDRTIISGLVQFAIEAIVYSTVAENFGQISPPALNQLIDGFDAAPVRGAILDCIPVEKACFVDWMLNRIAELQKANPGDDAKVVEGIHAYFSENGEDSDKSATHQWEHVIKASGGTSEGLKKLFREMSPFYPKFSALLAQPYENYEAQIKQFKEEIQNAQNPAGKQSAIGCSRLHGIVPHIRQHVRLNPVQLVNGNYPTSRSHMLICHQTQWLLARFDGFGVNHRRRNACCLVELTHTEIEVSQKKAKAVTTYCRLNMGCWSLERPCA
jgi:hypothetical protein